MVRDILDQCRKYIGKLDPVTDSIKEIRFNLVTEYKNRLENKNVKNSKEKSLTSGGGQTPSKSLDKRKLSYHEFRWLLSALGIIASIYNQIGEHHKCE